MAINHSVVSDVFSLTKPKITLMAVLVAGAGLMHARKEFFFWPAFISLMGIGALVGGGSALNMYLERHLDARMSRTKDRPLPAGRLKASSAVLVGILCFLVSCFLLGAASNLATLFLGVLALVLYVFCYTPLKQKTWFALIVGSVPGAMPVALGYISLSNVVDERALALFLWAFLWQIPHFLAISLFREQEYTEAGFPVLSARFGVDFAKKMLLLSSWLLVGSTIALFLTGIISEVYLAFCLLLGGLFLFVCHRGAFTSETSFWAKRAFKASLIYQGLLFLALIAAAFF